MKRLLTLVLALLFCLTACQKAPEITITTPATIEMSSDGSNGTITFTANRDWTARASESWVHISQTSGEASKGQVTITVRCDANTTYDDRTATVTITIDGMSQTVKITQPANLGIVLPTQSYDLQAGAKTIEVVVQANVEYTVDISAEWIKQTGTKGLTSTTYTFSIEENTTYDNREGQIAIKPKQAGIAEQVISVRQAQKDALNVEKTSYEMPYGGGEIEIKVEANVDYSVTSDSDWLHYVNTKGLSNSTVLLKIDENATYAAREGKVDIKQQNGTLKHTITVNQAGRIAVASVELNKTELQLEEGASETLIATVKPDNATDKTVSWSSSDEAIATVDTDGKVTAVSKGTATIKAIANDGSGMYDECSVTVYNIPAAVDLGLSVKWASYNVGASKPEEYGDYYAWGETEPKENYTWSTYKWGNGFDNALIKYNTKPLYGVVDNKTTLEESDDVAHLRLGGKWRMPTDIEMNELLSTRNNTSYQWEWKSLNGHDGLLVTYLVNNNSIFLPAASIKNEAPMDFVNVVGKYWSSSQKGDAVSGRYLGFSPDGAGSSNYFRYAGLSVRPVFDDGINPVLISLNRNSLSLSLGQRTQLTVTVLPGGTIDKSVQWASSNGEVVTVSKDGLVTAVGAGEAIITVTTNDGGLTASCHVKVKKPVLEAVDMGVSVMWASCNLGASKPEEYGDYYAWGETEPKENYMWSTYKWGSDAFDYKLIETVFYLTKYNFNTSNGPIDNKAVLDAEDDVAHVIGGNKWRMPTDAEWEELRTKCTWTWVTNYNGTGINGCLVTAANGNSIFLPAAGHYISTFISGAGTYGDYWSSSLCTDHPSIAKIFSFNSVSVYEAYFERCSGVPIRPVTE